MRAHSTQRGGTIFGLLIGLAVGVSIAVAIAFWFAKQSPVVSRMQPKGSLSETEEANKNKTWDPNVGLFGKAGPPSLQAMAANAASAASAALGTAILSDPSPRSIPESKSVTPVAPPNLPASGAAVVPNANAKPKGLASAPAASADPVSDLLKAKAKAAQVAAVPPAASPAAAVGDTGNYFVQVGAFKEPEEANAQKAKLALLGIESKVTEREQSGKTMYRVRAGVFKKIEDAQGLKAKLDKAGFDSVLVKAPN